MQEKLADPLADLRPARLARVDDLAAFGPKAFDEEPGLCALARAVDAFESDEHGDAVLLQVIEPRIRHAKSPPDEDAGSRRTVVRR